MLVMAEKDGHDAKKRSITCIRRYSSFHKAQKRGGSMLMSMEK
jgi:hypothetical protein